MPARIAAARRVRVEARAKLNLGLAVGPRRPDGFHELATVFQSISLADTLEIEPRRSGFSLEVRHEDVSLRGGGKRATLRYVPAGDENLVLRAARRLAVRAGRIGGARFRLVKRIPARAGLGGGSADAAAALVGLSALYGLRLRPEARLALALELGADVPFALRGGTALGLGRGERLRRTGLDRPFRALIAVPAWRISTPWAFGRIDRRKYGLTAWKAKRRFAQVLGRQRITAERALRLGNDFEDVLGSRRSDYLSLRHRLESAGVCGIRMTGSGSAVFGIVSPGSSAYKVAGRFAGKEPLFLVRSSRAGLRLHMLR